MDNIDCEKKVTLVQAISTIDINDISRIEHFGKYVTEPKKNIYVCMHPSGTVDFYHTHDFFEINYVYEGECVNMVEKQHVYMKTGDFMLIHPGTFHTVYADTDSKVVNILIKDDFFEDKFMGVNGVGDGHLALFINSAKKKTYYSYVMCPAEFVKSEFESLMAEEVENKINSAMMQEALILHIIIKLLRNVEKSNISDVRMSRSNVLSEIIQYMMDNYKTTSLADVSREFGYSQTHVCRMFSTKSEKTFVGTLNEIRMEKALSYLKNPRYKISEIASVLGYDSIEYFYRLFKSHHGITPQKFRESVKKERNEQV